MIYANLFQYRVSKKGLEDADAPSSESERIKDAVLGFIHLEREDEEKKAYIETKLVKNLKWLARKNNTNRIVLHSFAHLSESKASPEFVKEVLSSAKERLEGAGYKAHLTPIGYFLDLKMEAPGHPLARVFKEF